MKNIKDTLESIVATLPIGLYAKRKLPVSTSDEAETSYYSPMTDEIVVSIPIIEKGLENMPENYADEEVETAVRSMVYHEVSHVVLTPRNWDMRDYENVFEDERIESVLNNYYLDTDFKDQVYRINGYQSNADIPAPQNGDQAFYNVVRFHYGKEEYIRRAFEIIRDYADIISSKDYSWCGYESDRTHFWNYQEEVRRLYKDICKDFENDSSSFQPSNGQSNDEQSAPFDIDGSIAKSYDGTLVPLNSKDGENGEQENASGEQGEIPTQQGGKGRSNEIAEEAFSALVGNRYDQKLYTTINAIIQNFNKKSGGGNSISSYSGILNPRNVANDNFRYFDRKCAINGQNQFGSMHLNLFLDNSGSFYRNREKVNALLAILCDLEKRNKNFSISVIHCGVGQRIITDKKKYGLNCNCGTLLTDDIFEQYRSLQKPNTYNYNIVLYDGECIDNRKKSVHNFRAFSHPNCMVISDPSNARFIEADCKQGKYIITNDYTNELYDNVIKALKIGFR